MAVSTKTIALTATPIDLAQDAEVADELASMGRATIAIQNTAVGKSVFYADVASAPAAGSRDGLLLRYGDVTIYQIDRGDSLWIWSTTTATIAINEAG